tara:strand:+ start:426 stop:629 length:204 start_codon:yes stop_codon:yes gene_type:complete
MAVNFNGGFKVGGVEYRHPLSSEEIRFLLTILKTCDFKGAELENLMVVTMKLQEEYKKVLEKEQQTK